ncbi:MAG: hypothetical protein K6L80_02185 [Agarilytica sp.]
MNSIEGTAQEGLSQTASGDDKSLTDDGYISIASVTSETDEQGITMLALSGCDNPFSTVEGISSRRYSESDVGKRVACTPLIGSDRVVIVGFLPEDITDERNKLNTVLDEVLASTQENNSTCISEEDADLVDGSSDEKVFYDTAVHNDAANKIVVITDGQENEHLVLRAETALTLQCGDCSISLTSDGRVRINGRYIHTRASHTQRLSGGAVKIN